MFLLNFQTNLLAQHMSSLTVSNPVVRAGPSIMTLIEKRTTDEASQPSRSKLQKVQQQRPRNSENKPRNSRMDVRIEDEDEEDDDDDYNNDFGNDDGGGYDNTDVDVEGFNDDEEEDSLRASSTKQRKKQSAASYSVSPKPKQKTAVNILKKPKAAASKKGEHAFDLLNAKSSKPRNVAGKTESSSKRSKSKKVEHVQKTPQKSVQPQAYTANSVNEVREEITLEDLLSDIPHSELLPNLQGQEQEKQPQTVLNTSKSVPINKTTKNIKKTPDGHSRRGRNAARKEPLKIAPKTPFTNTFKPPSIATFPEGVLSLTSPVSEKTVPHLNPVR